MSALVGTQRDGDVAVIIVDNPPVNALKHDARSGIQDAFLKANADKTVAAIVLTCAGRTFIAGADISEFNKPPQSPSLIELIAVIDATDKPVVAAMPDGAEAIVVHPVGNLAMSWDHRAFDGAYAAGFLKKIKQILETRDWSAEV